MAKKRNTDTLSGWTPKELRALKRLRGTTRHDFEELMNDMSTPVGYESGSRTYTFEQGPLSDEALITFARGNGEQAEWARWVCEEWDIKYA